jgi:cytochrome c
MLGHDEVVEDGLEVRSRGPEAPTSADDALHILGLLAGAVTVLLSLIVAPRFLNRANAESTPSRTPRPIPPGPAPERLPPSGPPFSSSQRGPLDQLEPHEGGDPGEIYETPRRLNIVMVAVGIVLLVMTTGDLALRGLSRLPAQPAWAVPGGDTRRAQLAIAKYGCGSCHTIPGIHEATGRVGPMLTDFKKQGFIAGKLANVPYNLVSWIQHPQNLDPGVAMPNLGVTQTEAKDIADFLYAQSGQ